MPMPEDKEKTMTEKHAQRSSTSHPHPAWATHAMRMPPSALDDKNARAQCLEHAQLNCPEDKTYAICYTDGCWEWYAPKWPEPEPGRIMSDAESQNAIQYFRNLFSTQLLESFHPWDKLSRFTPPPKPLTRRYKLQSRLLDYRDRIALAWDALRGERMVREDDLL